MIYGREALSVVTDSRAIAAIIHVASGAPTAARYVI